jgi:hypothetical protein
MSAGRMRGVFTNGSVLALIAPALAACGSGSGSGTGSSGSGATAQVSVPSVVGDTQAAATTAITGAGLTVGTVTQQSSGTVTSGEVISENPAANASLAKGSAVALVTSTGPGTFTIGGTVIGLSTGATVQVVNGADNVPITVNGSFTLPTAAASGGNYSVALGSSSPSGQTCGVQNGSGTVASADITNVVIYCTYTVTNTTLNNTYTTVAAVFDAPSNGTTVVLDEVIADTFNGLGDSNSVSTVNAGGTITANVPGSGTYTVATTNAVPAVTNSSGGSGGIQGANANCYVAAGTESGTAPSIAIGILPNTNATTDSVNGNYTQVGVAGEMGTGDISVNEGSVMLSNGTVTGTLTLNTAGTIFTGIQDSGQFAISNGLLTAASGSQQGAISADGDLIVVANTASGGVPGISVLVPQGTDVTNATFEGVYSVAVYGGNSTTAPADQLFTVFAYGNGTYSVSYTQNNNGAVSTGRDTGIYTVTTDGTLTLTGSSGDVHNGGVSADGNALVFASITSDESPAIYVGVRQ